MSDTVSENSSKKTKRGRKEDDVWDHFTKESIGEGHYSAVCSYCSEKWSKGRPNELKSHLALYCDGVPNDIKIEYLEILATISSNKKLKKNDGSSGKLITNFYESSTKIEKSKKDRI